MASAGLMDAGRRGISAVVIRRQDICCSDDWHQMWGSMSSSQDLAALGQQPSIALLERSMIV